MSSLTDPTNLAANRQGQLTDEQRQYARTHNLFLNYSAFVAGFGAIIAAGVFASLREKVPPIQIIIVISGVLGVIALVVGLPVFQTFRFQLRLQHELIKGNVEQAQGRIYWRGNSYVAEADGHRLKTQYGLTLEPGDYTLYYLPQSRWLVGVEKLPGQSDSVSDLQHTLARLLHCDLSALDQNRQGQLSEGQRLWLGLFTSGYLGSALALFFAAIFVGFNILSNLAQDNWYGGLIVFVMLVGVSIFLARRGLPFLRDLSANIVRTADGRGKRSTTGGARNMTVYFHIGNDQFKVSPGVYYGIVEGVRYRVFYTPQARRIVNVEVVK